jgi:hypothetical protein
MAAASTFTVHVKNLAGKVIDIENVDGREYVFILKNKITNTLGLKFNMVVRLTHIDESTGEFIELEDLTTLNSYPIDYEANELNLLINIPIITHPITSDEKLKFYIKDSTLLDSIPRNTEVINNIQSDMVGKTIYILTEPNATNGLQCVINMVGSNADVPQSIQIQVIKEEEILTLEIRDGHQITKALRTGRVRLLNESNSNRAVAQGGRRKRSRRTKRKLYRRRRTHRKH